MQRVRGRRRALWFTIFWAALGVGSYVLGVRNELGQRAEESVLDAAEFTTSPPPPLNLVSIPSVAVALIVVGVIALAVHGVRRAIVVTVVPACAIIASQLLKQQLLTRPALFELDLPNTFPSGHMTVFMALMAGLIWAVPARGRAIVALGSTALLGAVGWQLLAFGWHRPSDVFGGVALGALAFSLVCLLKPVTASGQAMLRRSVSVGLAMCGWILLGGACVLALAAWVGDSPALMLSAGEFGSVGLSALASRSILLLSSPW
ncbi:phosphatase PAP2 family protein [Leucobacter sp. HY1908]